MVGAGCTPTSLIGASAGFVVIPARGAGSRIISPGFCGKSAAAVAVKVERDREHVGDPKPEMFWLSVSPLRCDNSLASPSERPYLFSAPCVTLNTFALRTASGLRCYS